MPSLFYMNTKGNNYLNITNEANTGTNSTNTGETKDNTFLFTTEVGNSWKHPIEIRFNQIIQEHLPLDENPSYWYKALSIDKSDASKIRRGLLIPPLWQRIKIAKFFNMDSTEIWKIEDLTREASLHNNTNEQSKQVEQSTKVCTSNNTSSSSSNENEKGSCPVVEQGTPNNYNDGEVEDDK